MTTATKRLIGIGVGPGDPELITVRAVRELNQADVILVPATESRTESVGRAEAIVLAACPQTAAKIRRIPFSMSQRVGVGPKRQESWQISAEVAMQCFAAGAQTVAFATVGDPSVYSTFSYLRATVAAAMPEVGYDVVPGITAMQAVAAASQTPLVEGTEVLALVPATVGTERIDQILGVCESVTIYKGGRTLPQLVKELNKHARQAVIGTDVSLPNQQLCSIADVSEDTPKLPYFSVVLSAPRRDQIGGSL